METRRDRTVRRPEPFDEARQPTRIRKARWQLPPEQISPPYPCAPRGKRPGVGEHQERRNPPSRSWVLESRAEKNHIPRIRSELPWLRPSDCPPHYKSASAVPFRS